MRIWYSGIKRCVQANGLEKEPILGQVVTTSKNQFLGAIWANALKLCNFRSLYPILQGWLEQAP